MKAPSTNSTPPVFQKHTNRTLSPKLFGNRNHVLHAVGCLWVVVGVPETKICCCGLSNWGLGLWRRVLVVRLSAQSPRRAKIRYVRLWGLGAYGEASRLKKISHLWNKVYKTPNCDFRTAWKMMRVLDHRTWGLGHWPLFERAS